MNIVRISAGLGNQMFQYAFYLALKAAGHTTKLDISEYRYRNHHNGYELDKIFAIHPDYATAKECNTMADMSKSIWADFRRKVLKIKRNCQGELVFERASGLFSPELLQQTNSYFVGFWQTERYFEAVSEQVRREFVFKTPLDGANRELAAAIAACNAVSLHVRCGDYLKKRRIETVGSVCTPAYYQAAIDRFSGTDNLRFFVFSDDIRWVKTHLTLPPDVCFVDINHGAAGFRDMQLMSLCRHHIIANSSFSWWGAWLNPKSDKRVIAPAVWVKNDDFPDITPAGWERVPV